MLSLQRFFSKSRKFFDLLDASAAEAQRAVHAVIELLEAPADRRALDEFVLRRRQNKRIAGEMTHLLCHTFVTPLDREDIESLARALYRIPKTVEKFGERLMLFQSGLAVEFFSRQVQLMAQATDTVCAMVRQLRSKPQLEKIREEHERLHYFEGEADKLVIEMLRELYSGKYETLQVMILRDLFELLEKVVDRCRDAGNVVFQIVLKNS